MSKKDIQDMLVSMGFKPNYIQRAFIVYVKNYGNNYNVEVITEIIVRLQNKDLKKKGNKDKANHSNGIKTEPPPKAFTGQNFGGSNNMNMNKDKSQKLSKNIKSLKPRKKKVIPQKSKVSQCLFLCESPMSCDCTLSHKFTINNNLNLQRRT